MAEGAVEPTAPLLKDMDRQLSLDSPSFEPTKFESPCSTIELTVSAKDLINRDTFSKSDPVCILYIKNSSSPILDWIEIDRTECVKNDLNPCWGKKFRLEYKFEERQILKLKIYDWDGKSQNLDTHDFLGSVECALGEIVASPHSKLSRELQLPSLFSDKDKRSTITIVAEELGECRKVLSLKIGSRINYKSKNPFGDSRPCLVISKQLDDRTWTLLHKTDRFNIPFSLRISSITSGGNLERPLRWQVFDKNQNSKLNGAKLIGEFTTNYLHLLEQYKTNQASFELNNRFKRKQSISQSKTSLGFLDIQSLCIEEEVTFVDHIKNGLQLSFSVAIDFTASNGDPARHSSLHYKHGAMDNPYVLAIKTVGEIIQDYSHDKRFAAFGFGAKGFPAGNKVSHNFPINLKQNNPYCDGIDGILASYYRVFKRIKLFGPTCFTFVIREQARIASESVRENRQMYHILVLLTDGIISDPDTTRAAIVKASVLPMSIIIIGVGDEDFKDMEKLDCDGSLLRDAQNNFACRDIVQFVDLKKFVNFKSINPINPASKAALAGLVLAELPFQVCEWMKTFTK